MFALLAAEAICLKADDALAAALEREGSAPFTCQGKSAPVRLGYGRLPDAALDDPAGAGAWARRTLDVALARRRRAGARAFPSDTAVLETRSTPSAVKGRP